jgi:hypothetical protein
MGQQVVPAGVPLAVGLLGQSGSRVRARRLVSAATTPRGNGTIDTPSEAARRTDELFLLILILRSRGAEYKCAAITTPAFTNTKAGVEPSIRACPEET